MSLLPDIDFPTMIEQIEYEAIVERKLSRVKEILLTQDIEYVPSEADDLMTMIQMDAYEEMLLRTALNEKIKQNFLSFATGSNLDHIGMTRYGTTRLEGTRPKARFGFTLSLTQDSDVLLPKGMLLGSGEHTAVLISSVTIPAGSESAEGMAELEQYVEASAVKTEDILTPIPWAVAATQITAYEGGATKEDDDRYRDRIWLGRERKTTAGSVNAYTYYTLTADVRVEDVGIGSSTPGVVDVAVLGRDGATPQDLIDAVSSYLSADEIRPLTDNVVVVSATVQQVAISATLYAKSTELVNVSDIEKRFAKYSYKMGVGISIAKIYDLLQDENIVDVTLNSPLTSIEGSWDKALDITLSLQIKAVS